LKGFKKNSKSKKRKHLYKKAEITSRLAVYTIGAIFIVIAALSIFPWVIDKAKDFYNVDVDYEEKLADEQKQEEELKYIQTNANNDFKAGNYASASVQYKQLIAKDKGDLIVYTSYFEIAKTFYETKEYDESMKYYEFYIAKIEKSPNDPKTYIDTAYEDLLDIYVKKGKKKEAEKLVESYKTTIAENEHYTKLKQSIVVA